MPDKRIAPSEELRQRLEEFLSGGICDEQDPASTVLSLAARVVVQEALEAEQRDAVGRERYERGSDGRYRNGYRRGGILKVEGKGGKERVVGFSVVLDAHFRRYLPRRAAALASINRSTSGWVFPNQEGGQGLARTFQQRLKAYGRQAGITRARVSPHTFRHTFAVWFVRKGGSPFHLQKILGHTTIDMSRRYCELADVDFVDRQRELSPLVTTGVAAQGHKRLR